MKVRCECRKGARCVWCLEQVWEAEEKQAAREARLLYAIKNLPEPTWLIRLEDWLFSSDRRLGLVLLAVVGVTAGVTIGVSKWVGL